MKLRYLSILAALGFLTASCATQTASRGSSTDDIYYSGGDASSSEVITTTTTTTTSSSDAYSTFPSKSTNYEYAESTQNDNGYRESEDVQTTSDEYYDENGNTYIVNNYYDDNNYEDYYYTSSLYRFYYPNYGFGFYSHCYSPYFYDPFWGPSYGWGMGYGWGYGNHFNNGFGYPGYGYYGFYDPWFNPYYGYGGFYNGYNNGFYNGYYGNGNGYGNDGYYGYSDSGNYYGPNTTTGSNTNTGSLSSTVLDEGYDKHNSDLGHVLTDKGALTVDKANVNTTAGSEELAENGSTIGLNTDKAGVTKADAVAAVSNSKPGSIAIDQPTFAGAGVVKENSGVKVIKYYSADANPAVAEASVSGTNTFEVKTDRGPRGTDYNTFSKPVTSNDKSDTYSGKPANSGFSPSSDQTRQQGTIKQQNNYEQAPSKQYEQPRQNNGKTYEQPKQNSGKTYEQPSKSTNRPTYEAPKSNSGGNQGNGSYNSGSSPRGGSGSSGSKPSSSGNSKRSGGN